MTRPTDLPGQIASLVLRGVLLFAGLVFTLALLAAGLFAAVGLVLWGLLRGRRPEMQLYWRMFRAATARRPFGAAGMRRPGAAAGMRHPGDAMRRGARVDAEVVDVEVREIPAASLPPQR